MTMELLGNVVLSGEMECQTGLHIGQEGTLEIGGVDSPVIKNPVTGQPYIPGSSVKGKLRSLLEWDQGLVEDTGEPHTCDGEEAIDCPVCRIFGTPAEVGAKTGPTRLTIRDAYPTAETLEMWNEMETSQPYTEVKTENTINRTTAESSNLRHFERVPRGSTFDYEFVYTIYDLGDGGQQDLDRLADVERGLVLLQDDALGGSGSRGYGQIEFLDDGFEVRTSDHYAGGDRDGESAETIEEVGEIIGIE